MVTVKDINTMTKQQLLGWKRGPTNNNNKAVPDFGDLMNADCAMVEVQADMDISDAPTFPGVPKEKAEGRPLSPGAILEKAEQDAKKVVTSTTTSTKITRKDPKKTTSFWKLPMKEDTEVSEYPELDYLFDFECKAGSLTYDPETCKAYDILYDPNNFSKSDYVPIHETLQTAPVFDRVDVRMSPEPGAPVNAVAGKGGDKNGKRKTKGKRKSKIIVDADVEMLESWTAEIDEKVPVDYGKMRKEQRKRFEKMGIYR